MCRVIVSLFWSKKIGSLDLLPILLFYDFKYFTFFHNPAGHPRSRATYNSWTGSG